MNNRKKNTVVWILTWAVLFLVIAYSPIGRPDLYVVTNYSVYNQGVNFKGGITNAPKGAILATDNGDESEMTEYVSANNYNTEFADNAAEYSPQNAASQSANYSNTTETNGSGSNNPMILTSNSTGGSAQGTVTAQNNDVSSLSNELTLTSSATNTRQAAGPNKPNGGRDPGGKNPKNPIPVGDGIWTLLLFAGIYIFRTYKKL